MNKLTQCVTALLSALSPLICPALETCIVSLVFVETHTYMNTRTPYEYIYILHIQFLHMITYFM